MKEAVLLETDDPTEIVETAAEDAPHARHWRRDLLLLAGYLALSLLFWRAILPHLSTRALGSGMYDPGIFIWFLNWTPYALMHGLDPFRTSYIDAPAGVSAMWNTSVIALGVLFAPVALAFGPIVSFNVACILGPPLSAWTATFWLRRHVGYLPAALGGLLFGFSPFVLAETRSGHLMFTWFVLVPVILMLVEDLLWRVPNPIWPQAPLLGLVVFVQFLISSETLLIVSMVCAGVAVALALRDPRAALARLRVLAPAGAVAAVVALVLCAWPLVELFGGGRAIKQPVQNVSAIGGSTAMLVGASPSLLFHTGTGPQSHLSMGENGLYIGWPLLLLLLGALIVLFRRRGVITAAVIIVVSVAFQMYGSHWHLAGFSMRSPLGFVQDHLALTHDILPGRFAIAMWIAIAWLFAVALDTALERVHGNWRVLAVAAAVACLVPLLPSPQQPMTSLEPVPALFSTSLRNTIPKGAIVVIAPMASVGDSSTELWQIKAKLRFRQVGGYALHAVGPDGAPSYYPYPAELTRLFRINYATGQPFRGKLTPAKREAARKELRETHASLLMVGPSLTGTARQLKIARWLLGPPDRKVGGVTIWTLPTNDERV